MRIMELKTEDIFTLNNQNINISVAESILQLFDSSQL